MLFLASFFGPGSCYSSSVCQYKGLKFENNNAHPYITKNSPEVYFLMGQKLYFCLEAHF